MWIQDEAPSHIGREVTDYLNTNYQRRWTGQGRSVAWPDRSPDLTLLDSFMQVYELY
jgi:hypothetical protein